MGRIDDLSLSRRMIVGLRLSDQLRFPARLLLRAEAVVSRSCNFSFLQLILV